MCHAHWLFSASPRIKARVFDLRGIPSFSPPQLCEQSTSSFNGSPESVWVTLAVSLCPRLSYAYFRPRPVVQFLSRFIALFQMPGFLPSLFRHPRQPRLSRHHGTLRCVQLAVRVCGPESVEVAAYARCLAQMSEDYSQFLSPGLPRPFYMPNPVPLYRQTLSIIEKVMGPEDQSVRRGLCFIAEMGFALAHFTARPNRSTAC